MTDFEDALMKNEKVHLMPDWLLSQAMDSDEYLSSLPQSAQPAWFAEFDAERKNKVATAKFISLLDSLSTATGSSGLTSFHGGKVHMTLDEYERLVSTVVNFYA